jgi:hypothetical protein
VVSIKELPKSWFSPAVSPDGNSVVFTDEQGIHIQELTTGKVRHVLAHRDGYYWIAAYPAFAPDGNSLFFFLYPKPSVASARQIPRPPAGVRILPPAVLYRISLSGGDPHRIAECSSNFQISPDGRRIAFGLYENGVYAVVLAVIEDWIMERRIPYPGGLVWSPDAASIAGVSYQRDHSTRTVSIVSTSTGERRELFSAPDLGGDIVWGRETGILLIRIQGTEFPRGGAIWQYTQPGGVWRQVTTDGDKYTSIVSASPDGLAVLAYRPAISFWDGFYSFFGFPGQEPLARELVLIRLRK